MSRGILARLCKDPSGAVLLYAGTCPRCRFLARLILSLAAGSIKGMPLTEAEWRDFYADELPESRGWPVLVHKRVAHWGPGVFPLTLWLALCGYLSREGRQ